MKNTQTLLLTLLMILQFSYETYAEIELEKKSKAGATFSQVNQPCPLVYLNERKGLGNMQTLSGGNTHSGGYGAIQFKGSRFKNSAVILMGIRGAWIANRSFGLGIDLNGVLPLSKFDDVDPEGLVEGILVGGYGGLLLEPVLFSNKLVHLIFPVSLGAGWLGYLEDWEDQTYYSAHLLDDDFFWYLEPGVALEINVTNYFRISTGISKRFTQDLDLLNTSPGNFENLNYSITLKFGGF